jgi:hypothetical protein
MEKKDKAAVPQLESNLINLEVMKRLEEIKKELENLHIDGTKSSYDLQAPFEQQPLPAVAKANGE